MEEESALPKNVGLTAHWIWKKQDSYNPYQQVIAARKFIKLEKVKLAEIRLTTDGWYRLFINGEWVTDGPCRSWPEHFQFDVIDAAPYLVEGRNEVLIIARHWSVGNFHTVPRQAGLLAQLDVVFSNGSKKRFGTDETWRVAELPAWIAATPKVSIQMEPQEFYDARMEGKLKFESPKVLFPVGSGPWRDLHERDTALLTRRPVSLQTFVAANLVKRDNNLNFCVPTSRLATPGIIEANYSVGNAGGMASILILKKDAVVRMIGEDFRVAVNGRTGSRGSFRLKAGRHLVLAFSSRLFGHHDKERSLRIIDPPADLRLENPLQAGFENPWCWIRMREFDFYGNDLIWPHQQGLNGAREQLGIRYVREIKGLLKAVKNESDFHRELRDLACCFSTNEMFVSDPHSAFRFREVIGSADDKMLNPTGLMYDNGFLTVVNPSLEGDVELVYDLGEQSVGYYELDLHADSGVEVDLFGVEYFDPQGGIQHTWGNRNGMRYITREGRNRFISLKRRSQRYLFITLRHQIRPVKIRKIQLVESTYPVDRVGGFDCSDARLTKIYDISAQTLKLCMEDTFTDCPLYEQTLWVGDARNEALYNFSIFGAQDIVERCIRLAAQSLDRYPIVGCQVPSSWDCLLPAWSFLWGISVWDYYEYSGEQDFLRETWPAVLRNLENAKVRLDDNGLFSGRFWNMFDWSGIDDAHATVLHNSMLLVGAIDAAQKMAMVLYDRESSRWLGDFRKDLTDNLNRLWDPHRRSYPDSIHEDGTASTSISMHTSFLAVLYDIVEGRNHSAARNNMLNPPDDMVKVGSPFAIQYLYEALEKVGEPEKILASIYNNYLPMLAEGATTVWEVFPASKDRPANFPTRSHCHAWSAAPLYFLPRLVLGIRQRGVGGIVYEISPRPNGLTWANGAVASPQGPVKVKWELSGRRMDIMAQAPHGVKLRFKTNESLAGLEVRRNF